MNDYEDFVFVKRSRGKDKAKNRYVRNGGYSTKHLRIKQREYSRGDLLQNGNQWQK